jgi:multiple sugar transport system permease protein
MDLPPTRIRQGAVVQRNHLARSNRRSALLFFIPGVIFFGAVFVYPILETIQMAFSSVNADNIVNSNWPFVGLQNFISVFQLQATGQTLSNTAIFLVSSIVPQVVIGLLFAIGLRKSTRWTRVARALILLPWLLPTVTVASVFVWIFYTNGGLANWVLEVLGIVTPQSPVLWLAEPGTALLVIILVNIWIGIPFNFLIIQSGLQSLPDDVHEAAEMDGAGWWRELFSITIPMLKESLFAVTMLGVIGTLRVFDFVWIMTGGGPANATMLPGPLAYQQAFVQFNYGVGSAIIVLTVVAMAILSLIYVRVTASREGEHEQARELRRGRRALRPGGQVPPTRTSGFERSRS